MKLITYKQRCEVTLRCCWCYAANALLSAPCAHYWAHLIFVVIFIIIVFVAIDITLLLLLLAI